MTSENRDQEFWHFVPPLTCFLLETTEADSILGRRVGLNLDVVDATEGTEEEGPRRLS